MQSPVTEQRISIFHAPAQTLLGEFDAAFQRSRIDGLDKRGIAAVLRRVNSDLVEEFLDGFMRMPPVDRDSYEHYLSGAADWPTDNPPSFPLVLPLSDADVARLTDVLENHLGDEVTITERDRPWDGLGAEALANLLAVLIANDGEIAQALVDWRVESEEAVVFADVVSYFAAVPRSARVDGAQFALDDGRTELLALVGTLRSLALGCPTARRELVEDCLRIMEAMVDAPGVAKFPFADAELLVRELAGSSTSSDVFELIDCFRLDGFWVHEHPLDRLVEVSGWGFGAELSAHFFAACLCVCPPLRRQISFDPAWRSETAVALAAGIYADRAFDRMPILADALEEAGCDDKTVLNHCRDGGLFHCRGDWVIDLLLGHREIPQE